MVNTSLQVVSAKRSSRVMRSPLHPFTISHMPYHITPFVCAPVLPGETMKHASFQVRAVTDPIVNPLAGWWLEYYFFYVKLSDLYERDDLRTLVIDPAGSTLTAVTTAQGGTAADITRYYAGGTGMINYPELCLRRVVDEYFRDEGEDYTDHVIADPSGRSYPLASIVGNNVLDSAYLVDDETAVDVTLVNESGSGTLTAQELDAQMRLWQQQRLYGLTTLTYEDWLRSFGVKAPDAEQAHRPELLRYIREWSYPTNTIDPTNGTARSAVSWTLSERLDKARSFNEPGFVFGVAVCRPKVYVRAQEGSATCLLNDWKSWIPGAIFSHDPLLTRKTVDTAAGPLQTVVTDANGYSVDIADLFLYGEQFTNRTLSGTVANNMDCVSADLTNKRYPIAAADIAELFTSGTTASLLRSDGIVSLEIACAPANPIVDMSPRGGPLVAG